MALWNRFKGMPLCYETLHLIATESHDWSGGIGLMYFLPQAGIHLRWSSYVGLSVETPVRLWGRQSYRLRKKLMATRGPAQRIQLYVTFRQHQSGGRKLPFYSSWKTIFFLKDQTCHFALSQRSAIKLPQN